MHWQPAFPVESEAGVVANPEAKEVHPFWRGILEGWLWFAFLLDAFNFINAKQLLDGAACSCCLLLHYHQII